MMEARHLPAVLQELLEVPSVLHDVAVTTSSHLGKVAVSSRGSVQRSWVHLPMLSLQFVQWNAKQVLFHRCFGIVSPPKLPR